MTAEIAIMNKEAVALAADSAVTVGRGRKIFTSANKLFMLSKHYPVGIMVYGDALFMGVPWETIVKIYRNKFGSKVFPTLREYAGDFLGFLNNGNPLFPESVQDREARSSIYAYFAFVKKSILDKVHSSIDQAAAIDGSGTREIVSAVIKEQYDSWDKADTTPDIASDYPTGIENKYGKLIDEALKESFEKLPIPGENLEQLRKIGTWLFSRFPTGVVKIEGASGVVIAGFGESETFPSLYSFDLEGVVLNRLKYKEHTSSKIDFDRVSSVTAFAQREMVSTFMEGIDPSLNSQIEAYLAKVFDEYPEMILKNVGSLAGDEGSALLKKLKEASNGIFVDYRKKMTAFRRDNYITPVINVVSILPKDELAAMAESLVNLTSFKRKVTMESETVGGPVDVAVISKGDGFIWIKRKHYFRAELNPHFLARYYEER